MSTGTFIRRQDVENKAVLDTLGKSIGTGQDIAFSLDGKLALVVKTKKGDDVEIPMTRVAAVADYIVLTAEVSAPTQTHTSQTCPNCGMPLKPGAKFCTSCGMREVSPATQPATEPLRNQPTSQPPTSTNTQPTCHNCGMPLKPGAKFCTGCGVRL